LAGIYENKLSLRSSQVAPTLLSILQHRTFADKLYQAVPLKNFQIHGVHTQTVKSTEASSMEIAVKYVVDCHMIKLTPSYYGAVSSK